MRVALRYGLQARFLTVLGVALLLVAVALSLYWQEVRRGQAEAVQSSHASMRALLVESLRTRGEAQALQLSDALVNPMYYVDLATIGELARSALRQADVSYVLVFDAQGRVLHDGSGEIAAYGRPMDDAFAFDAIAATGLLMQHSERIVDISHPVAIGNEKLGGVRIGYSLVALDQQVTQAHTALRAQLDRVARRQLSSMLALLGTLALLAVGLSLWMQRRLVWPLQRLAEAARAIDGRSDDRAASGRPWSMEGNATPDSRRGDELGDLVRAFDQMSGRIGRHSREIHRMAYSDSLTGLPNRLAFRESLDHRLLTLQASGGELALLFIDLDEFKRVNDTYGHDAGDQVLSHVATRIRERVHDIGGDASEVARFGGDEFVVLIMGNDRPAGAGAGTDVRERATALAEALIAELQRPFTVQARPVFLGASVGITLFPHDAASAGLLLKDGDIAMYQAKIAGKNCFRFYSRAMDQAVERRVEMEHDLRGAWDRGEMSVSYQPIFQMASGRLVGAEALLRWQHPRHGLIPPSVFIDVAEQSGLIDTLGRQVLRQACADAMLWRDALPAGSHPFVSVNVSARQLRSGDLPELVASVLGDVGMEPQLLHVELTETAVLVDERLASTLLSRLRATGVKVWLDDFGTGFSGLSHLRRVPVDGVKIDRSFVTDLLRDPDDLALTSAIIAMAHSLGITVVAEGVENEGQYAILREHGCDQAQGFWLGRPMTGPELVRRLRA